MKKFWRLAWIVVKGTGRALFELFKDSAAAQVLFIVCFVAAFLYLAFLSPSRPVDHGRQAAPAPAAFAQVGRQGMIVFAWIDPAKAGDRDALRYAAARLDHGGPMCKIFFWTDRSLIPSRLPMTDAQVDAHVAEYLRNPRGRRSLRIGGAETQL